MKKIILTFICILNLIFAEIGDYNSNLGIGLGVGLPSGYEIKGIYRLNDWISLEAHYNLFKISNVSQDFSDSSMDLSVTGNVVFSNPGIILNYHLLGGNWRAQAGFLYDIGGIDVDASGTISVEGQDIDVNGGLKLKLGNTYPYIGVVYGYDYNSSVHLELSAGAYLLKSPSVSLDLSVEDAQAALESVLDTQTTLSDTEINEIMAYLEANGWDLLLIKDYAEENYSVTIDIPSESELEAQIISGIDNAYSMLPEIMGYNILPVVSIGFTVFPF